MSNLHKLKWSRSLTLETPFRSYRVRSEGNDKFAVFYESETGEPATGFTSILDAMDWAENTHYAGEMQPYVKPDSITDIANWFKKAKPEPTIEDLCVQIGCCLEEVAELLQGLGMTDLSNYSVYTVIMIADSFKSKRPECLDRVRNLSEKQRIEIVDACCDINVTSVGVMQLLGGVDVLGAQREVIRSNNSKMVDGRFEFDENGKIAKPDSYSKPDLTPFISTMQNLHNASEVTK